jgi:dTDP-4-amino-4,6-dideoxygalactose transaminase
VIVPFNRPHLAGKELDRIRSTLAVGHLSGDGESTAQCHRLLEQMTGSGKALLTHSCTAALEMAAILADLQPGDEVVMPSYTFVSTANAFVLRGAVPMFVDIRADTLNMDETRIEEAITQRTRAIVPVHYAGVGCAMQPILEIARTHELMVIEDAAQGIMATQAGRPLGSIGELGTFSFHETKNLMSGEGGALLVNDPALVERAEIIREKGTNRSQFFRGQVDKYTWMDIGSSYLPSELIAAVLLAQLEAAEEITARRRAIWQAYHEGFAFLEESGRLRRPVVPEDCDHNGHMYYLLLRDLEDRTAFISSMKEAGIHCVFHYVPLHSSPYGRKAGRACGDLPITNNVSDRLVRLPFWIGLEDEQPAVIEAMTRWLTHH